jgi:hypothetical protein
MLRLSTPKSYLGSLAKVDSIGHLANYVGHLSGHAGTIAFMGRELTVQREAILSTDY